MPSQSTNSTYSRAESAAQLAAFEATPSSQRQFEAHFGVPRTTLQHWLARKHALAADPAVAAFFESPQGTAFLGSFMVALFLVFDLGTSSGLRHIGRFLKLSGLGPFVAASFGACQRYSLMLEAETRQYGRDQRATLVKSMSHKRICIAADETFHPSICLVAMEPVSNFIFVEQYADDRTTATWTAAVQAATKDLPVTISQGTTDQARPLIAMVEKELGAHSNSDVFHVQQELSHATSLALAAQSTRVEEAVLEATLELQKQQELAKQALEAVRGPGRPLDFEARIEKAKTDQAVAMKAREDAQNRQELAHEKIREVGEVYHPFNLRTGERQSAREVRSRAGASEGVDFRREIW